jgi:hypothetical protein
MAGVTIVDVVLDHDLVGAGADDADPECLIHAAGGRTAESRSRSRRT